MVTDIPNTWTSWNWLYFCDCCKLMTFHMSLRTVQKDPNHFTMFMFWTHLNVMPFTIFHMRYAGMLLIRFSNSTWLMWQSFFPRPEQIRSFPTRWLTQIALSIRQSRSNFAYATKWLIVPMGIAYMYNI